MRVAEQRKLVFLSDVGVEPVLGGAERTLRHQVLGLASLGHEVHLVHRGSCLKTYRFQGVPVHQYPFQARNRLLSVWQTIRHTHSLVGSLRPDLLIGHQPLSCLAPFTLTSIPRIYVYLSSWPKELALRRKKRLEERLVASLVERCVLRRAQLVSPISQHAAREVRPFLLPGQKVRVNLLGVDLVQYNDNLPREEARGRLQIGQEDFVLVTVRNLVERMGLPDLIQAFSLLSRRVREHPLLLLGGDGPLARQLREMVRSLRLERQVRFLGHVAEEGLSLLYAAADLFVLPTRALENFGLVALEAFACGLPVIATPVGAIPEVVGKLDRNFLTRGVGPRPLYEKLLWAYEARGELRRRRGEYRRYAERFGWDQHVKRLQRLVEEVLCR